MKQFSKGLLGAEDGTIYLFIYLFIAFVLSVCLFVCFFFFTPNN